MWQNLVSVEPEGIRFKPKAVARYKRKVETFLELLLLSSHITGRQPARGTEMTMLRYLNALQSMQNIYMQDRRVMVVTRYHKMQALTGELRVIPRFLPMRVG